VARVFEKIDAHLIEHGTHQAAAVVRVFLAPDVNACLPELSPSGSDDLLSLGVGGGGDSRRV